ncbi:MAG: hypothetical protein ACFCVF_03785 [Kineosporiaceae bacterium]
MEGHTDHEPLPEGVPEELQPLLVAGLDPGRRLDLDGDHPTGIVLLHEVDLGAAPGEAVAEIDSRIR